jgi:hypothetical protein
MTDGGENRTGEVIKARPPNRSEFYQTKQYEKIVD